MHIIRIRDPPPRLKTKICTPKINNDSHSKVIKKGPPPQNYQYLHEQPNYKQLMVLNRTHTSIQGLKSWLTALAVLKILPLLSPNKNKIPE
jgi:hypothetical protein